MYRHVQFKLTHQNNDLCTRQHEDTCVVRASVFLIRQSSKPSGLIKILTSPTISLKQLVSTLQASIIRWAHFTSSKSDHRQVKVKASTTYTPTPHRRTQISGLVQCVLCVCRSTHPLNVKSGEFCQPRARRILPKHDI